VELTSYADTYAEVANLTAQVRRVMHGVTWTGATVTVHPSLLDEESDIEQAIEAGTDKPVYVRTQTFRILYRPN
jgi:hypothetical protein